MNNNNPISLVQNNFTGTFTRGQEPMSYSQAVKQAPAPEPLFSAITVVESPNPTDINDRTISNVWSINVEGHAIDFEFIDSASLPFTSNPEEVFYKCAFVNNEPTNPLISDLLFFTPHAIDRMEERQISYAQILYSLNAIPIESYDNKLVLNNNLESISTVVKLVESVGYIVATVVRKESPVLNLELLQYDMSLEPIYGDAECHSLEDLEQFYKDILADPNQIPHRKGKAAYNLAGLIQARFNILNEIYFARWESYIKRAIKLGHPHAKKAYVHAYMSAFSPDLKEKEAIYFSQIDEQTIAQGTLEVVGDSYIATQTHLQKVTAKNPLLVDQLTILLFQRVCKQAQISYDLLFKLFLVQEPKIILFLLVNHANEQIRIAKDKEKYLISQLFDLQNLKELFESLPSSMQDQTCDSMLTIAYDSVLPVMRKNNLAFCKEILVERTIQYGANLKILNMEKKLWELEIFKGVRVIENFALLIEFYSGYISEEQGSSLLVVAECLDSLAPYLKNYPGIVIYQAARLLKALTEEAKSIQDMNVFIKAACNIIETIMNNLISQKEREGLGRSEIFQTVSRLINLLVTNKKTLNDSIDFYTFAIKNYLNNWPTLQAFFFLTLAQILQSEGNIEAECEMLKTAETYCLQKAQQSSNSSKTKKTRKNIGWTRDQQAFDLIRLIKDFQSKFE